ncbi:MAG: hypothetical protein ICV54_11185 [Nostoc sp. C3-bin3]|nr:hypothetical protein [Nostoc sp. C3-bin3]
MRKLIGMKNSTHSRELSFWAWGRMAWCLMIDFLLAETETHAWFFGNGITQLGHRLLS